MPKVLHILTNLNLGGAQISVVNICVGLRQRGFDVRLVYSSRGGRQGLETLTLQQTLLKQNVPVYDAHHMRRGANPLHDLLALWQLRKIIKRERPDIVHTHMSKAGVVGRMAAALARSPYIVHTAHGWSFYQKTSPILRRTFIALERISARYTDIMLAVSPQQILDGLRARIGEPSGYIVCRPGVDLKKFRGVGDAPDKLRTELSLPPGSPVVGTVMSLTEQKSPLDFVAVAARVLKIRPDVHFLVVGDGPLRATMHEALAQRGIVDQFHITGLRTDVPRLLKLMDIFLLTSRWEGIPRVVLEAMMAGVPVVSTSVGGVPEVVEHGQSGLLAPSGDTESLADNVLALINEPDTARRMAERAAQRITYEFDLACVVSRHAQIYEELLRGGGDARKRATRPFLKWAEGQK
jgi:glycosyltransferase involved in cell wall biosynthesis